MGFSRQEYWSGLPFPSPGGLPDPGIEPRSPTLQADALTTEPSGKPIKKENKKLFTYAFSPKNKYRLDISEDNEIGYVVNCLPELDMNGAEETENDLSLKTFIEFGLLEEC